MAETSSKREQQSASLDRISDLPKPILTSIFSLLPIEEAARTSLLSTKWRYLWNSIPYLELRELDLNELNLKFKDTWRSIVYHILFSRQDPVESVYFCFNFIKLYKLDIDNFILFLCNKGIQELSLFNDSDEKLYRVTPCTFFCSTLRKLNLWNCRVTLPPSFKRFCNLKTLQLGQGDITSDELERLISCCPVLEKLRLDYCWWESISIRAPSLLSLEIRTRSPLDFSLKDLTQLEHASFYFELCSHNGNDTGQMVELLMNLSHVQSFYLNFTFYKCLSVEKVPQSLPAQCQLLNLNKLTMRFSLLEANIVFLLSCVLRSCPHLQDLELMIVDSTFKPPTHCVELDYWEKQKPTECLMYHLRTVKIYWLDLCCDHDIGFVKYLLMTAHVLKRMSIVCYKGSSKKARDAGIELSLLRKASPCAVLEFKGRYARE
ncbi:F-box/FBD/LRR-repeat protein At1g13570-like [Tasmannia lanceolata]|uniref:F-box/FBD/LRR-repeat protein At1g13570-like n=1 Tax=Tasmannia lanceolata TaxID=3420 RepID=UPI0040649B93